MAYVLAHQGGWDEILLVAIPLLILALLLILANSRAKKVAKTPVDAQESHDPG